MSKPDEFSAILMALQGVTVLETPRVSRETIISTVRDHTLMLRDMKKGLANVTDIVTSLAAEAGDNRRVLQNIQDDNKKMRQDIDKLYGLNNDLRGEMSLMGEKVSELYVLKAQVKEHREFVDNLNFNFEKHVKSTEEYHEYNDNKLIGVDKRANDTIFQLKELKVYVETFADNLILPSSQITVEASSGYGNRPVPLLEVLKSFVSINANNADALKDHNERLVSQAEKIDTKADDGIIHDVKGIARKVTAIENHILKEEEQGIGAIRRGVEELSDKMQGMATEMTEKMDRREVSFIVHEKYEEIVKYLQDALQSSTEDENNFKEKADEIQQLVMTLNNTKADRVEIAPMQEILVKTEGMLKKMTSRSKEKESVSKKELEALLQLKVDKIEFESQLNSLSKGNKRTKKLAALGVQPSVIDEMGNAGSNKQTTMDHSALMRDKAMWKSIADSMKDESEEMILRAAYKAHAGSQQPENGGGGNGDGTSDFSAYILSKKVSSSSKNVTKMSLPNTDHDGSLLQNTEGGHSGGVALSQRQFPTGNQTMPNQGNQFDLSRPTTSDRPSSTHGYAGGMGQPGGPTDLYANPSSPYPHVPPNNQRDGKAEEKGSDFGTGGPPYIQAGGQGTIPDHVPDMTYIGGQTAGGGFNTRGTGGLAHGQMKSLMETQPTSPLKQVQGLGVVVQGEDANYYKTDHQHGESKQEPPTSYPKPINTRK
jgi:hypothetical protein